MKDLAAAIAIEVGELQEILLWEPIERERDLIVERRSDLADEIADVIIHCLNFADRAGIDILEAVHEKIKKNENSYPVEIAQDHPKRR
ncbi:MAG: MazG-like family protein [Acidimicrobiales bacterium]